MQNNDFRPDKPGTQVIDVYTVGFTTSPAGERPAVAHGRAGQRPLLPQQQRRGAGRRDRRRDQRHRAEVAVLHGGHRAGDAYRGRRQHLHQPLPPAEQQPVLGRPSEALQHHRRRRHPRRERQLRAGEPDSASGSARAARSRRRRRRTGTPRTRSRRRLPARSTPRCRLDRRRCACPSTPRSRSPGSATPRPRRTI